MQTHPSSQQQYGSTCKLIWRSYQARKKECYHSLEPQEAFQAAGLLLSLIWAAGHVSWQLVGAGMLRWLQGSVAAVLRLQPIVWPMSFMSQRQIVPEVPARYTTPSSSPRLICKSGVFGGHCRYRGCKAGCRHPICLDTTGLQGHHGAQSTHGWRRRHSSNKLTRTGPSSVACTQPGATACETAIGRSLQHRTQQAATQESSSRG